MKNIRRMLRKIFTRSPSQRPDMAKLYGLFNGYTGDDDDDSDDDEEEEEMGGWSDNDEDEEDGEWNSSHDVNSVSTQPSTINSRHVNLILTLSSLYLTPIP